jgi:membrane-bound lytic murein transglycosylase D
MQKIAVAVFVAMSGCAQVAPPPATIPSSKSLAETRDESAVPRIAIPEPRSAVEPFVVERAQELPAVAELARPAAGAPPASLWVRIHAGFGLADVDNALVREWEQWYSSRPEYVARMIERSSRFLYYVVEEVEKRGMPMEIALLPMVESAYNPVAYSKADASGMWQFIASTGKHYGLRQSWWYDGRRDVVEATDAALDYLDKLHAMFGDWSLALAAYNCGEGAVSRAIERNLARGLDTTYEALTLPAETREYVPKLIAVRNIVGDPARYRLEIADISNEPYLETVGIEEHIDVALAATLAELPVDEFRFLNPAHRKPIIKAGEGRRIVLPRKKLRAFLANLQKHDKPLVSWKIVRLRRGQKPQHIAASHGMTIDELKRVSGVSGRRFAVGQPLLVRVRAGIEEPELPDIAVRPVSLPLAFKAAKAKLRGKGGRAERAISRGGHAKRTAARVHHAKRTAARPKATSKYAAKRRR